MEKAHRDLNLNARPVDGIVMIVGDYFIIHICHSSSVSVPFCAAEGCGLPLWYLETDLSLSSGLLLFQALKSREIFRRLCA